MKPFHTIAVPHRDILEGKLTMEVFAADLWETHMGRAPPEYKDPDNFFKKTYVTDGLRNLLEVVEGRLKGKGGDPVIQIQTPFGGGKTHALIAMYHKAKQWGAKVAVVSGTTLSPEDTLWGMIEKQFTGKMDKLSGNVSPGREALRKLLESNQPALILIDEVLQYATRVSGVSVKDTTLAVQTIAFMQELTEVAGTLEKVSVVITLPSSIMEHYDAKGEKLFQQLQKVSGRVEKVYTPVKENEITKVIRRRLFSTVDLDKAKSNIAEFLDYAEKEGILPIGKELSEYRQKFNDSYPFLPDVVETLYHRWGTLPTFQRTRGVLRLLSLVIHSLQESGKPYISLADFDLSQDEIRRELIKYIGPEFDSVVAVDITNTESGSKRIDRSLGKSFQGLMIGTRTSTSIFMYSFSGEIKRAATTTENPPSVVAEAVEQLKSRLFHLQNQNDKYYFSNQPNLNRIILTKMENIKEKEIVEVEHELVKQQITGGKLQVFLWPEKPKDISDTPELKLIVLPDKNSAFMKNVLESKGESPRIYRNTLFFLCPSEAEKAAFLEVLKRRIAYSQIDVDKTLNLTQEQRDEVKDYLKRDKDSLRDAVRRFYRIVCAPSKEGFKEVDLGIPTYGDKRGIDQDVYDKLRSEEEILEKIAALVIREGYLRNKDYVKIQLLYDSMLKTPGESRAVSKDVVDASVVSGVKQGLFGVGELGADGAVACKYFKEEPTLTSYENEVIIKDTIAMQSGAAAGSTVASTQQITSIETKIDDRGTEVEEKLLKEIILRFNVPRGKVSQVMGVMNLLQSKFQTLELGIKASDGSMSEEDYSNKIKEALRQLGIKLDE
jgi:hypothetical protein